MWKIMVRKIQEIGEGYKLVFLFYPRWYAILVAIGMTVMNIALLPVNLIYIIWSSWYLARLIKRWKEV